MADAAPYELEQLLGSGTLGRPIQELAPVALEVLWLFWTAPIVNLLGGAPPLKGGLLP